MTTIQEAMNEHFVWETQGRGSNKTYTVSIGKITAQGPSKALALSRLLEQVRLAMGADYHPRLIVFRGWHVIIYRTPVSTLVFGPQRGEHFDPYSGSGPYPSREEAERQARVDLACLAWDGKEETSPVILRAEDQQEFRDLRPRKESIEPN